MVLRQHPSGVSKEYTKDAFECIKYNRYEVNPTTHHDVRQIVDVEFEEKPADFTKPSEPTK